MLKVYADFVEKEMAIPVVQGVKSETERFAGALLGVGKPALTTTAGKESPVLPHPEGRKRTLAGAD